MPTAQGSNYVIRLMHSACIAIMGIVFMQDPLCLVQAGQCLKHGICITLHGQFTVMSRTTANMRLKPLNAVKDVNYVSAPALIGLFQIYLF